jgi:AcrR family transcriptional regulator
VAPPAGSSSVPTSARRGGTQRERLVNAMIAVAANQGSDAATVAQISSQAGVSSATFYQQFENKEACLLAAYRAAAERLLVVRPPIREGGDWAQQARRSLREFALSLQHNPDAGRLLFVDMVSGGTQMREVRGAAVRAFDARAEQFLQSTPADCSLIDLPPQALVGASRSIIARYLRNHGESELPGLVDDGLAWMLAYVVPPGGERWSTGPGSLLALDRTAAADTSSPPSAPRLPRGRHSLPAGLVARSHRTRILYATAEVTQAKGYADTTVADIVAAASVSRDVFYEHFADKQDAFLEAQNHPTLHILERCASAYFGGGSWPERVWSMFETLLAMICENPAISHLRLVECYAAGPAAIRRAEEITRSFTIFYEEGYSYGPETSRLPRLTTQAIAGASFELIQRLAARGEMAQMPALRPRLTYLCIAPFMGAPAAIEFLRPRCASKGVRPTP